jgi:hypothetical protein
MKTLLKAHFGDCKYLHTSTCSISSSYQTITDATFYIYDAEDDRPVQIVAADKDHQLIVRNTNQINIEFVKTDKCLFTDQISKCDCILYSTSKLFFVEIKWSSSGTRNKKRNKAVEQLAATIEEVIGQGIDLTNYETKAIICFKRQDVYPTRASSNTQKAIFLEKYKVKLEEGNTISF